MIILKGNITFLLTINNEKIYSLTFVAKYILLLQWPLCLHYYNNLQRVNNLLHFGIVLQQVQLMKCKYIILHLLLLNA